MVTTGAIEGRPVERYLGPVSAQVVIGTGALTDFLSSFTDFFGVNSRSYENKLDQINRSVLTMLEEKCARMGGNAVLALRVDHDEIAGAGKSMLMVTGSGTAVRLRELTEEAHGPRAPRALRPEDVGRELRRRSIIASALAGKLPTEDEVWEFIRRTPMPEVGAAICARFQSNLAAGFGFPGDWRERLGEYIDSIGDDDATDLVFGQLENADDPFFAIVVDVATKKHIQDFARAAEALSHEEERIRRRTAILLHAEPAEYGNGDVALIRNCADQLEVLFPKAQRYTDKVGVLKTERLVWKCVCGKTPSADIEYCPACGRDGHGFTSNEADIPTLVRLLRARAQAIEEVLGA